MPHHRAGDRLLEVGELVILDFGGMLNGYAVDMTRTVVVGSAGPRERRLLEQVAEAQQAAFAAVADWPRRRPTSTAARDGARASRTGRAFSHGTGHGLGLEVHERPRLAKYRPELPIEPLQAGMVFTLEPGAYIDGWGGVRIEDDVVVDGTGSRVAHRRAAALMSDELMTLDEIKQLIEFIKGHDLSEFELEQDGVKIRIKSGGNHHVVAVPHLPRRCR